MPNTNFQIIGPLMNRSTTTASASQNVYKRVATGHADNLSDLPDDIIYRILCVMETRDAIRLCATLQRWRYFWKSIPILYFNSKSFEQLCNFKKFINMTLEHRGNSKLKVLIYYRFGVDHVTAQRLLNRVLEYAASHDVEEIRINLRAKTSGSPPCEFPLALYNCKSLKLLELKHCRLKELSKFIGFNSLDILHLDCSMMFPTAADYANPFKRLEWLFGYTTLTTLLLNNLTLSSTTARHLDPFNSCVNLKNLQLTEMSFQSDFYPRVLRISAPNLSNLNLMCNRFRCNIVVTSRQLLNINYLYFKPQAYMSFSRLSFDVFSLRILHALDAFEEFHPNTSDEILHGLVNVLPGDHETGVVKLSFCTAVVMCGAAASKKLECLSHRRRMPLEIGVRSTLMLQLSL